MLLSNHFGGHSIHPRSDTGPLTSHFPTNKMAGDQLIPNGVDGVHQNGVNDNGIHQNHVIQNGIHQNGVIQNGDIPNGIHHNGVIKSDGLIYNNGIHSLKHKNVVIKRDPSETERMLKETEALEDRPAKTENCRKNIDGGYAWVVLACAFTLNVFMSGQFGTLGLYLVEYMHYFDTSKVRITYIGACQMFVGYFLGLFNGALMKRFGCRIVTIISSLMVAAGYLISAFFPNLYVLYVFYGVISGIGFLNFYLVAIVAVQQYFDKKRAFATGVCTSGLSVGIFMWSPFTRFLIDKFSWQGALTIQAGIFLNGVICGLLLRPPPPRKVKALRTCKMISEIDLRKKRPWHKLSCKQFLPFYLFLLGYFCIQLGHMTLYSYTPVKCDSIGMPKTKASFLVSLMGITGIFARPVLGLIGDCTWANRTVLIALSALSVGTLIMISTQLVTYIPLAIFSATFGFLSSGYMALYGAALVDIVNLDNIEVTSGALMVSKGTANLTLHLMSGWLLDVTGDVNIPFLIFGAMQALGGLLILPIPWIQRCLRAMALPTNVTLESEIS